MKRGKAKVGHGRKTSVTVRERRIVHMSGSMNALFAGFCCAAQQVIII